MATGELYSLDSFIHLLDRVFHVYGYNRIGITKEYDLFIEIVKLENEEGSSLVQETSTYVYRICYEMEGRVIRSKWMLTERIEDIYAAHCIQFQQWATHNVPELGLH